LTLPPSSPDNYNNISTNNSRNFTKKENKVQEYISPKLQQRAIMNCWEFINCGREKGGFAEEELGVCPAYPDNGKNCYNVVGTFCANNDPNNKLKDCLNCPFYLHLQKEQGN